MRSLRRLTMTVPTGSCGSHTYMSVAYGGISPVSACTSSNCTRVRSGSRAVSPSKPKSTRAGVSSRSTSAMLEPGISSGTHQEKLTSCNCCGGTFTRLRHMLAEWSASASHAARPSFSPQV